MKKNTLWGVLAIIAIFALGSCKKDDSSNAPTLEIEKLSGVVADNPLELTQVPAIVSPQFIEEGGARSSFTSPENRTGYQAKGRPTKDGTPPVVNITAPLNGAVITGSYTIMVYAEDNVGLSSVTMTVNGSVIANWVTAPFNVTWSPATNGTYTLTATAKDLKGNVSTHSIIVSKSTSSTTTTTTTTTPSSLPSSLILQTPPVMYQGGEGSCLSMALTVQRNIEQYYSSSATSYSTSSNQMSPEFLFNYTKVSSGCGSGAAMGSSLEFLRNRGICTWSTLPYDIYNGCDTSIITTSMKSEALNFRLSKYNYLIPSDQAAIKNSLYNKHPLTFTFQMDYNFYNATPGYIWNSRGTLMSTHAITIVGYDDTKRAYKAQNSWGTSWGDAGFIWIDYDFFPTVAGYCYTMNYN